MTLEELQVVITANVAPMLQGLKEAQASLQDVSKAAATTGQQATSAVTKAATQTSKALQSSDAAQKDSVEAAKQAEQAKSQSMEEIADIAERAAARYNESLNSMGNGGSLHEPVQLTGASGMATSAANTAAAPQEAPAVDTEPQMNALQKLQAMALKVKQSLAGMFSGTSQEAPAASEALETLTAKLDNINARADLQRQKLTQLQAEYDSVASSAGAQSPAATQLQEQILNTEARLQSLTAQSDKTAAAIADLNAGLEDTGAAGGKAAEGAEKANSGFKAASSGASSFEQSLGRIQAQIFRNLIVYGLLIKGIQSLGTYMFNALDTNTAFANSLNNLKVQFLTAFNPIYQAILPALTSLINALAKAMSYAAAFIAGFFGTTYSQANKSAAALNNNVKALQNLTAASKAAKSSVSGFDEVNTLTPNSNAASSAADAGLTDTNFGAASTKPTIDTSGISAAGAQIKTVLSAIAGWATTYISNPLKKAFSTGFDFSGIKNGLGDLQKAFTPFANNVGQGLKWAIDNILAPLAKWVVNTYVPTFLGNLADCFKLLNPLLDALKPLGDWLWNNFLLPIAEWTGGVIVTVLGGIGDGLKTIGDWINDHQEAVQNIAIVIGSFAAAIGLVSLALGIGSIAMGVWDTVCGIGAAVTAAFDSAIAVLTSPITLVIAAIAALIAGVILCIKYWPQISGAAVDAWNAIKTAWNACVGFFQGIWAGICGAFKDIGTWFPNTFGDKGAWGDIKTAFADVGTFFSGIWSDITGAFTVAGIDVKTWFGNTFNSAYSAITSAFNGLGGFFSGLWSAITGTFKTFINEIIGGIDTIINAIDNLHVTIPKGMPGAGTTIGFPYIPPIPKLATGGIINSPTLAMIGEAGPEAVVPLKNTAFMDTIGSTVASAVANAVMAGMSASSNNNNYSNNTGDIVLNINGRTFARIIKPFQDKEAVRAGSTSNMVVVGG
jgi:predicted  nucleic acid-binding Zn-ribbon protein